MRDFIIDINPEIELPQYNLVLCKMNEEPIQELYNIEELEIKRYFANIDEISFKVPLYRMDNDGSRIRNELFDLVDGNMMVLVNDMKYFILTKPQTETDEKTGEIYKTILGFSREYELIQKQIVGYDGVSRMIYDPTHSVDENGLEIGFLNYIERNTSWRVGYVNANLLKKYRHLSFSKSTYLQALQDVQQTFGCLFRFDTINKVIDAYEVAQLGKNQGLYISDKNFLSSLSQRINYDEVKTRLYLYGRDNISIQEINVTGQPYIENFNFFKNTKYMTQDLIDALNEYEEYVKSKEGEFQNYLSQLEVLNEELSIKNIELRELQTELRLIQSDIDVAIADRKPTDKLKQQEADKLEEIETKQSEIDAVHNQINDIYKDINTLRQDIDLSNHLTKEHLRELDPFIREDEFSDTNYTEDNIDELLEEGKKILARVSYPRIQFDVDVYDFLSLVEGQHMWDKLVLGDLVTLEHEELGLDFEVRLVGYEHSPDEHSLRLIFSNRESVDDANIYLSDLLDNITTTASTVDFNRYKWDKGEDVSNKFTEYINNYLNLSNQAIAKAEGQRPMIDDRGIWLYKENPDGSIDPKQIRAINNIIALTQDNWNTVDVAITPDGVVAAKLIGNIILGADLKIVSDNGIVEILNNLISIKDDKNRLRVALGNYDVDKYGLLIKDSSGTKTILDENGILQTWQEGRTDNVDASSPLRLHVFIPSNTRIINKAILRFKRERFRAYSTSTESGGGSIVTSRDGGGRSITSSDGGGATTTSSSGGGYNDTTYDGGGGYETTRGGIDVVWRVVETFGGGADLHTHKFERVHSHAHDFYIPSHSHRLYIPSHTHSIRIPSHRHDVSIPSHRHDIDLPAHSHGISYGIYESTLPSRITVKINGIDRTSALGGGSGFNSDRDNLDVTPYLAIGRWNTIELGSSALGRIDATIFIQVLMNITD